MFRTLSSGLVVSVAAVYSPARADEAEARAVAFVEKLGGRVTRDENAPGKPIIGVDLSHTDVRDTGLKELAPLFWQPTRSSSDTTAAVAHQPVQWFEHAGAGDNLVTGRTGSRPTRAARAEFGT